MSEFLGDRLKDLRNDRNLTLKEVGEHLGLALTTIAGYESGAREPDLSTLKRLAVFYSTSIDELLGHRKDAKISLEVIAEMAKQNRIVIQGEELSDFEKQLIQFILNGLLERK